MEGLLLVDKPQGWTSHDAVARVRSFLKQASGERIKVGHIGTLDPMATGLLVLLVGSFTKQASSLSKLDKTYEAEITLGKISTTDDAEGAINDTQKESIRKKPTLGQVEAAVKGFVGEQMQTPPAYSAIKVAGRRAYALARKGKAVELKARPVTIYQLHISGYKFPKLYLRAKVSSGTYIRSLARDIGEALQTGAYLSGLVRTRIGNFELTSAAKLAELNPNTIQNQIIRSAESSAIIKNYGR